MINKNIIVGIAVLAIIVGSAYAIVKSQFRPMQNSPEIDSVAIGKDAADLDVLSSDVSLNSQDDTLFAEINSALNEIGEISGDDVMDGLSNLSDDEASLNGFSSELSDISSEEASLKDLDQAFSDVSL